MGLILKVPVKVEQINAYFSSHADGAKEVVINFLNFYKHFKSELFPKEKFDRCAENSKLRHWNHHHSITAGLQMGNGSCVGPYGKPAIVRVEKTSLPDHFVMHKRMQRMIIVECYNVVFFLHIRAWTSKHNSTQWNTLSDRLPEVLHPQTINKKGHTPRYYF